MKPWAIVILAVCLLIACTHQPQHMLQTVQSPDPVCDTLNITYQHDIQPIFSNNCYSCHSTAITQSSGLNLEDTVSLKQYLQYSFRGDGIYGSKLYHCMMHSASALPMPPDYIVDSCSMQKMKRWLSLGGPLQ